MVVKVIDLKTLTTKRINPVCCTVFRRARLNHKKVPEIPFQIHLKYAWQLQKGKAS